MCDLLSWLIELPSLELLKLTHSSPPHALQAHYMVNVNHHDHIVILETSYLISKNIALIEWFKFLYTWRLGTIYFYLIFDTKTKYSLEWL